MEFIRLTSDEEIIEMSNMATEIVREHFDPIIGTAQNDFIINQTKSAGLSRIELNVNKNNSACFAYEKLGFEIIRTEKNDIGCGFYMDDYVYSINV